MQNITQEQADVIGEVANICTGTAATALSLIINRPTNITTPKVDVLAEESSLASDDRILVKVPFTKGLDGTNLMVLHVDDALIIANLMMGGDCYHDGFSAQSYDRYRLSAHQFQIQKVFRDSGRIM